MNDIIRDAPFGQLLRYVTRNRVLKYPEEEEGFECPCSYEQNDGRNSRKGTDAQHQDQPDVTPVADDKPEEYTPEPELEKTKTVPADIENPERSTTSSEESHLQRARTVGSHMERTRTLPWTEARLEAEHTLALEKTRSKGQVVVPTKTEDGTVLVDWYTLDDAANPQNWSQAKKAWTAFLICLYTFVVYASSSIYVSSEALVMERFGVGDFKAGLGLALYVLGMSIPSIW